MLYAVRRWSTHKCLDWLCAYTHAAQHLWNAPRRLCTGPTASFTVVAIRCCLLALLAVASSAITIVVALVLAFRWGSTELLDNRTALVYRVV